MFLPKSLTIRFCCFSGPDSGSSSCSPVTQPQIKNSICVGRGDLTEKYSQKTFAKSPNCKASRFCCFDEDRFQLTAMDSAVRVANLPSSTVKNHLSSARTTDYRSPPIVLRVSSVASTAPQPSLEFSQMVKEFIMPSVSRPAISWLMASALTPTTS